MRLHFPDINVWLLFKGNEAFHPLFKAGSDEYAEGGLDDDIGAAADDNARSLLSNQPDNLGLDDKKLV